MNSNESKAFLLLHDKIQRWIYNEGWSKLRDIQEQAISSILTSNTDVIIASPTASGKTEAAFLPICSKILDEPNTSIKVLYIGPLKALINDQFNRISELCERLDIKVHRWHGDVAQNKKTEVLKNPNGILLITPESLEAIFCNHGTRIKNLFNDLSYVVIDELHSFIGIERGRQLQSQLHRIETFIKRRVPRIGLSATLGDMKIAEEYLRTGNVYPCQSIVSESFKQEIQLILRGYVVKAPVIDDFDIIKKVEESDENNKLGDVVEISNDIYKILRGTSNLIFANRKALVEVYSDILRRRGESNNIPNEFFPHHGSLSKELREDLESRLKQSSLPLNVVCTTTLEMGIDIGKVKSIAQIGSPPSVASMRQRLGRSGRQEDDPAILRIYIQEPEITDKTSTQDKLREELVQTIAMVELLIEKWCEPPCLRRLHLSTLIQQILSSITQLGGIKAYDAWRLLCDTGPFQDIGQNMFAELLRSIAQEDLISQMSDGTIILGLKGERIVNHYNFYTAFQTYEEYALVTEGKTLGSIPINFPLMQGVYLIFAGKRWEVTRVDEEKKVVDLIPAKGGIPPLFYGSGIDIHDRIREKMYEVYKSPEMPRYLDSRATDLLEEARENFFRIGLDRKWLIPDGKDLLVFLWKGSRITNTLQVILKARKLNVSQDGLAINVASITEQGFLSNIKETIVDENVNEMNLANTIENKAREKYDNYLSETLLNAEYSFRNLNIEGTKSLLSDLVDQS